MASKYIQGTLVFLTLTLYTLDTNHWKLTRLFYFLLFFCSPVITWQLRFFPPSGCIRFLESKHRLLGKVYAVTTAPAGAATVSTSVAATTGNATRTQAQVSSAPQGHTSTITTTETTGEDFRDCRCHFCLLEFKKSILTEPDILKDVISIEAFYNVLVQSSLLIIILTIIWSLFILFFSLNIKCSC
jgi:hypothetical protein